jgi:acyl carrier protein
MTANPIGTRPVTSTEIQNLLISRTGADPEIFEQGNGLSLEELGIDSLAVLELSAVVEDKFSLEVPEDALGMTIDQIVAHVNNQTARI